MSINIPNKPLPDKPLFGNPCNGCGTCCATEVCDLGQMLFKSAETPCRGLVYRDGKLRCALVLREKEVGAEPKFADALGIGRGCCGMDEPLEGMESAMTFEKCCEICLGNEEFVAGFNRLTNSSLGVKQTGINALVDKACGYDADKEAIPEFVKLVWETIWIPMIMGKMNEKNLEEIE